MSTGWGSFVGVIFRERLVANTLCSCQAACWSSSVLARQLERALPNQARAYDVICVRTRSIWLLVGLRYVKRLQTKSSKI